MAARSFNSIFLFITKPFHVLKKYPVLYHGHHINIVNFGIFAGIFLFIGYGVHGKDVLVLGNGQSA